MEWPLMLMKSNRQRIPGLACCPCLGLGKPYWGWEGLGLLLGASFWLASYSSFPVWLVGVTSGISGLPPCWQIRLCVLLRMAWLMILTAISLWNHPVG